MVARWLNPRVSPRSISPVSIIRIIKPSQIAVYPQIHICGLQGARGDQSIMLNNSTSSIFYPTSLWHCLVVVGLKTGVTEFSASGRSSFSKPTTTTTTTSTTTTSTTTTAL